MITILIISLVFIPVFSLALVTGRKYAAAKARRTQACPQTKKDLEGTVLAILNFILIAGVFAGVLIGRDYMRREAVERGYATWVANDSGLAIFKWKEASK